ncbi:sulfotransferase domain-containing protein [Rubellimicrobium roseum]|uniref:Sulfotransferase domain-containing protein n=1 Tax=Rubellimicrobium roseum TaxID=687525 RepID=A0A5C4N5L7_9RHOB|nr:sulfotransferase domain-containing protein [Rubellimicrobium roseum]TNC62131.1 sulfotransferase domain-containing protein [Rubellimicrobium roseum]
MFLNTKFDARFAVPIKTREIHNHHMDSTRWNGFQFRDGDIVVATWAKSGTTWTQQIVSQLIFNGAEGVNVPVLSPWVDMRIVPQEAIDALEEQTHRRFLKTHLPVDALVFSPKAKYIYVARDGRDAAWSAYNHFVKAKDDIYDALNTTPGLVGPTIHRPTGTAHDYYRDWFDGDGAPLWSFWENIRTWWQIRHLPNVKLVHFNELKRDLVGSIREIAAFLDIEIDEATFPAILEHCSFDYMKAHAELSAPLGGAPWEGGASTFINKGTNGRWQGILSEAEVTEYEARAVRELGYHCAHWLKTGEGL